jgi:uncharacterized protein involved in exopolysaccharide biosynthesis/Mrp family chromosome partitioning ATPase
MPAPLPPSSPSISVGDIYYILFRHKWRILLCATVGILAAAAIHEFRPPPYQSEAKLFIRYVVTDSQMPGPPGDDVRTKSPDRGGETIMGSELQILTSVDLAMQVAQTIGPEKILAKSGGGNSLNRAASVINSGLVVEVAPRSSVIDLKFNNADPLIVQPVLQEIIDRYLKMHVEIHRAVGIIGDFLTQETDQLRSRLAQTEDDLRRAKNKAGVISLEDTKKSFADQMSRIQQQIFDAQADLAQRTAIFQALTKTAAPAEASATDEKEPPLPPDVVDQYQAISSRIELLRKTQQQMLTQFTPENTRVKDVRAQLDAAEVTRKDLLAKYPRLAQTAPVPSASGQPAAFDVAAESIRLTSLQSRIKVLNAQMDQIRAEAAKVSQSEDAIMELQRKKDLEESNYRYYSASLEQSRINEALGSGKVSNISPIQSPSPPFKDMSKNFKLMAGAAIGGIAAGLAWAFLIEMLLDHSVRRPIDVERMLGVPLFLSIPVLKQSRKLRRLQSGSRATPALNAPKANGALVPTASSDVMLAEMEHTHALHTFHETLRDRLIGYFESRNLTHKPKLVAVTGLGRGSGVTTTAAGLASCLSETGEGNVLLVDMTVGQGSAQQFYRGKEVVGLEELFSTRDNAQVQDKLYVVSEEPGQDKLSRILPQRFTKLVPQLKASNFDYIIFDMPPVSQISITPRLAGFMDMVLMVIESEKTDRELVQRATALLAQSKAHVGAVLNKTRSYVPSKLHQEYLGNI